MQAHIAEIERDIQDKQSAKREDLQGRLETLHAEFEREAHSLNGQIEDKSNALRGDSAIYAAIRRRAIV